MNSNVYGARSGIRSQAPLGNGRTNQFHGAPRAPSSVAGSGRGEPFARSAPGLWQGQRAPQGTSMQGARGGLQSSRFARGALMGQRCAGGGGGMRPLTLSQGMPTAAMPNNQYRPAMPQGVQKTGSGPQFSHSLQSQAMRPPMHNPSFRQQSQQPDSKPSVPHSLQQVKCNGSHSQVQHTTFAGGQIQQTVSQQPSPHTSVDKENGMSAFNQHSLSDLMKKLDDLNRMNSELKLALEQKDTELQVIAKKLELEEDNTFELHATLATVEAEANSKIKAADSLSKFREQEIKSLKQEVDSLKTARERLMQLEKCRSTETLNGNPTDGNDILSPNGHRKKDFASPEAKRQRITKPPDPFTPKRKSTSGESETSPFSSVQKKFQHSPARQARSLKDCTKESTAPVDPVIAPPVSTEEKEMQTEIEMDPTVAIVPASATMNTHSTIADSLSVRILLGDATTQLLQVMALGELSGRFSEFVPKSKDERGVETPSSLAIFSRRPCTPASSRTPWATYGKSNLLESVRKLGASCAKLSSKDIWESFQKIVLGFGSELSLALALLQLLEICSEQEKTCITPALNSLNILLAYSEEVRLELIFSQSDCTDSISTGIGNLNIDANERKTMIDCILSQSQSSWRRGSQKSPSYRTSSNRFVTIIIKLLGEFCGSENICIATFKVLATALVVWPVKSLHAWLNLITKSSIQNNLFPLNNSYPKQSLALDILKYLLQNDQCRTAMADQDNHYLIRCLSLKTLSVETVLEPEKSLNCLKTIRLLVCLSEKDHGSGLKRMIALLPEAQNRRQRNIEETCIIPVLVVTLKRHLQQLLVFKETKLPLVPSAAMLQETCFSVVLEGSYLLCLMAEYTITPLLSVLNDSGTILTLQGFNFKILNDFIDFSQYHLLYKYIEDLNQQMDREKTELF